MIIQTATQLAMHLKDSKWQHYWNDYLSQYFRGIVSVLNQLKKYCANLKGKMERGGNNIHLVHYFVKGRVERSEYVLSQYWILASLARKTSLYVLLAQTYWAGNLAFHSQKLFRLPKIFLWTILEYYSPGITMHSLKYPNSIWRLLTWDHNA